MNAEDKAKELVKAMDGNIEHAKKAVDEIMSNTSLAHDYWKKVKKHLDKM